MLFRSNARSDDTFWRSWEAFLRCARIVRQGEANDTWISSDNESEAALAASVAEQEERISQAVTNRDFSSALKAGESLSASVASFFDAVLVNTDDPETTRNRRGLLGRAEQALGRIAEFSAITRPGIKPLSEVKKEPFRSGVKRR